MVMMLSINFATLAVADAFLSKKSVSATTSQSSSSLDSATSADVSSSTSVLSTTPWDDVPMGADDAILGIAQNFRACTDPRKVNVCVGAYRDEAGQPWVLPSVRAAEEKMLSDATENKEYLGIDGDTGFVRKALAFAYGSNEADETLLNRIAGVQTLSGTGACRIGGHFLADFYTKSRHIYLPVPTWGNHHKIFAACGLTVKTYRYYDRLTNTLDLEGMMEDLQQADDGAIVLLHACAHNPTGCDPSAEQWQALFDLIRAKGHLIFFDSAYQGFASGDAEKDASALRHAVREGLPVLLAQSFAKNFGLYGERCGTVSVVCKDAAQKDIVLSHLKNIIRPMYSSPPKHGSSIVRTVLSDAKLTAQYYEECTKMANRIQSMRTRLVDALKAAGSTHDWSHVANQIGMFAFTGLSSKMCDQLTDEYAIYLTRDGRISIAGLNDGNLEYVAKAVHAVTDGQSITSG
jgi:aspartate aminotransferase, mitochondrial